MGFFANKRKKSKTKAKYLVAEDKFMEIRNKFGTFSSSTRAQKRDYCHRPLEGVGRRSVVCCSFVAALWSVSPFQHDPVSWTTQTRRSDPQPGGPATARIPGCCGNRHRLKGVQLDFIQLLLFFLILVFGAEHCDSHRLRTVCLIVFLFEAY